jgi:amidohydrolase family protein
LSRGAARALAILVALAAPGCRREPLPEAEAIFTNARLATRGGGAAAASAGDPGRAAGPGVSIAVAGGRILAVGDAASVNRHRGARTAGADLGGDIVVAGFEDALARPLESGERLLNDASGGTVFLDLSAAETEEDAVQRVRQRARALGPGAWILGGGWDDRRWVVPRPPDARLLSDIVQSNPAFLVRYDSGSAWVNFKALDAAGLDKRVAVPIAGAGCAAILRRAPALSPEERRGAIEASLLRSVSAGVTAVQAVASTGRLGLEDRQAPATAALEPWRDLARRNRLPLRVSLLVPAPSAAAEAIVSSGPESFPGTGRLEIRALLLDAGGGEPAGGEAAHAGAATVDGAAWARRGAAAGFDIVVTARGGGVETARAWLAEARRARAETKARVVLDAKADLTEAMVAALAAEKIDVVVVAAADDAAAAGALAERLHAAHLTVLAGTGADGAPPAALLRFAAGPWGSTLAAGGPADFQVLPAASGSPPVDPSSTPGLVPLAVRVGGIETFRRGTAARPPG